MSTSGWVLFIPSKRLDNRHWSSPRPWQYILSPPPLLLLKGKKKYIVENGTMDVRAPSLRRCPEMKETWESKKKKRGTFRNFTRCMSRFKGPKEKLEGRTRRGTLSAWDQGTLRMKGVESSGKWYGGSSYDSFVSVFCLFVLFCF